MVINPNIGWKQNKIKLNLQPRSVLRAFYYYKNKLENKAQCFLHNSSAESHNNCNGVKPTPTLPSKINMLFYVHVSYCQILTLKHPYKWAALKTQRCFNLGSSDSSSVAEKIDQPYFFPFLSSETASPT